MALLRIGQVAQRSGLSVETLRYYEQRGLLPAPSRSPSGYRQYPETVIEQLAFIGRAKRLGFSLSEISGLLALQLDPNADRGEVKQRVLEKLEWIELRIDELQQLHTTLESLASSCDGQGDIDHCPIMNRLQKGD